MRKTLGPRVAFFSCLLLATVIGAWRVDAVAPAGRYDTATAGMVRDTKTSLGWQKDVQAGHNLAAAKSYCLGLGGGWRLPTVHELMTILDETVTNANDAKIDATVFLGTTKSASRAWTTTPVTGSGDPGQVWVVDFYFANISEAGVGATTPRTRCVRLSP